MSRTSLLENGIDIDFKFTFPVFKVGLTAMLYLGNRSCCHATQNKGMEISLY